jgi:hypothetical protein
LGQTGPYWAVERAFWKQLGCGWVAVCVPAADAMGPGFGDYWPLGLCLVVLFGLVAMGSSR